MPDLSVPQRSARTRGAMLRDYALATFAVAVAVAVCMALRGVLPVGSLALVFVCAVLAVALLSRTAVAAYAALLSSLSYNFFFTAPHYTLHISSPSDVAAVVTFLLAALTVGHLAARQREHLLELQIANERVRALQVLGQRLAAAVDERGVLECACEVAEEALGGHAVVVTFDSDAGALTRYAAPGRPVPELSTADEAAARGAASRSGAGTLPAGAFGSSWWFLPLPAGDPRRGAIGLRTQTPGEEMAPEQQLLAQAIAHLTAEAAHRTRLVGSLAAARVESETERLRTALLASVSHDLRSPLASILGAASTLAVYGTGMPDADRKGLVEAIREESERLDRYIQNLLDMTRLGSGPLKLRRDWVGLEEIAASARSRLIRAHPGVEVELELPSDLPPLFVHAALIEQALFNVLDNAARYSPKGAPIRIRARRDEGKLRLDVEDRGPGVPVADRERIFDLFYSTASDRSGERGGSGLGLTIVRGMLRAHGGDAVAGAGEGGAGTRFTLTLPVVAPPRAPLDEDDDG